MSVSRNRGFTLPEMMIAIAIMAILLSIAVPSFSNASLGSQLRASSTQFIASANLARSEAIKRNAPVTLCASSDGATCTGGRWEQGWIVLGADPQALQVQGPAPQGFRITAAGGVASVVFQSTGVGATPAVLTFCRATPVGPQERVVSVDAAGRTFSRRTTAGVCP